MASAVRDMWRSSVDRKHETEPLQIWEQAGNKLGTRESVVAAIKNCAERLQDQISTFPPLKTQIYSCDVSMFSDSLTAVVQIRAKTDHCHKSPLTTIK